MMGGDIVDQGAAIGSITQGLRDGGRDKSKRNGVLQETCARHERGQGGGHLQEGGAYGQGGTGDWRLRLGVKWGLKKRSHICGGDSQCGGPRSNPVREGWIRPAQRLDGLMYSPPCACCDPVTSAGG